MVPLSKVHSQDSAYYVLTHNSLFPLSPPPLSLSPPPPPPPSQVLPLENKMKTPQKAKSMVLWAMIIVTLLYVMFGTMGYLVYGNSVKHYVIFHLSSSTRLWASM